jgi:monoamine oxidase
MQELASDFCIVGAGYAGLTAAHRLARAGNSVTVMEARDRVGGRTWTEVIDGVTIDRGGAWIGDTHDRLRALMKELGVDEYPTFYDGDTVMELKGDVSRYRGTIPRGIGMMAVAVTGLGIKELDAMAREVPVDAPWTARKAAEWDSMSVETWLRSNVKVFSADAKAVLDTVVTMCFNCTPAEVSFLYLLLFIHTTGGLEGGVPAEKLEQARVVGGMQRMAGLIAAGLGDSVLLGQPVTSIEQTNGKVAVTAGDRRVTARRVIVATPPSMAGHIRYHPLLPRDRALLLSRMSGGPAVKINVIYDDAFWRADGLCGESAGPDTDLALTLDACEATAPPGVLVGLITSTPALAFSRLPEEERRRVVLERLVKRFGPKAGRPARVDIQDWTGEEWSRGGWCAACGPGVLTQYGLALRAPVGRIHWAGTETSTRHMASVDGAVCSGERAAAEVMAAESG